MNREAGIRFGILIFLTGTSIFVNAAGEEWWAGFILGAACSWHWVGPEIRLPDRENS